MALSKNDVAGVAWALCFSPKRRPPKINRTRSISHNKFAKDTFSPNYTTQTRTILTSFNDFQDCCELMLLPARRKQFHLPKTKQNKKKHSTKQWLTPIADKKNTTKLPDIQKNTTFNLELSFPIVKSFDKSNNRSPLSSLCLNVLGLLCVVVVVVWFILVYLNCAVASQAGPNEYDSSVGRPIKCPGWMCMCVCVFWALVRVWCVGFFNWIS